MKINIFAKGNIDIYASLHTFRLGQEIVWNGINEVLRKSRPGCIARVKHETCARFDALVQANGVVPKALLSRALYLADFPLESQFSNAVFTSNPDVYVFSIMADVLTTLVRHRRDGFLFYAYDPSGWTGVDREWLKSQFEPTDFLDVPDSIENLERVINQIRQKSMAPILIYNMSPLIPGEKIHCHVGLEEVLSSRIRRFNLALIELSARTGISIIDVDSLVGFRGAESLKLNASHLTAEGYRLIAEEVVRVFEDLGLFDGVPS